MENLITEIAKALVDEPGYVSVSSFGNHNSVVYELQVAKPDVGKIIGRKGRTIEAMRKIVSAAAARDGRRVILELID